MKVIRNNSKRVKFIKDTIRESYTTCFYCGKNLDYNDRTIDHLIPLAKNGTDTYENMVVSCQKCNIEKADMHLDEYLHLKLNGFDFDKRANDNKRKKGFGYEGAQYEEITVSMSDLISRPGTQPNSEKVEGRLVSYLNTGKFHKPTYVKKRGKKFIILQGFINYIIFRKLNYSKMDVILVLDDASEKKKKRSRNSKR